MGVTNPLGGPGYLIGESGLYGSGFEPITPGTACRRWALCRVACSELFPNAVSAQTAANVCYRLQGPNSNTGAYTYLVRCGFIPPAKPPTSGYPAPGWPGQPPPWINPILS